MGIILPVINCYVSLTQANVRLDAGHAALPGGTPITVLYSVQERILN